MIEIELTGFKELGKALEQLPEKMARQVLGKAVGRGARVILREAKRLCPSETGNLRKSLGVKRLGKAAYGKDVRYLIGPRVGKRSAHDGWYAHLVEFGTGPHVIRSRKKVLRVGKNFVRGEIKHPGISPRPFMRPAWDAKQHEALNTMRSELAAGLEAAVRKLNRNIARTRLVARRMSRQG